jgi:hypothetical protein
MSPTNLQDLLEQEYQQRLEVNRLRRLVYEQPDPSASPQLLDQLQQAEETLSQIEARRAAAQTADPHASGRILDTTDRETALLGAETTGLEVQVHLRMAQVPTAICHLFDPSGQPLVTCQVRNARKLSPDASGIRRLRVISYVDGYSARAVDTLELPLNKEHPFDQLPTLFPGRVRGVTELTRATLNVMVEDMDSQRIEVHKTHPIWLLARTTAPMAVMDPQSGQWQDMTPYLGAFVTPNAPAVMAFLRVVVEHHPERQLVGYQGDSSAVEPQVRAIFEALKAEGQIRYVNSVIAFSPEEGSATQRVRLPRESLEHHEANCIDGTVLFASLLEASSLSPAIVVVPGHAFVAWETWKKSDEWRYLETTMIGDFTFEQACESAEARAMRYAALPAQPGVFPRFRRWPLRELRAVRGITPME